MNRIEALDYRVNENYSFLKSVIFITAKNCMSADASRDSLLEVAPLEVLTNI